MELVIGGDSETAGTKWIVVIGDMHKLWKEDINSTLKTIAWLQRTIISQKNWSAQAMVCNVEFMSFFFVVYAYPQRRQSILF